MNVISRLLLLLNFIKIIKLEFWSLLNSEFWILNFNNLAAAERTPQDSN
ncbi:hypothetical protein NSTC745_05975 [Nostoc sp. DSM 114161]|jgi:hypothetical protein